MKPIKVFYVNNYLVGLIRLEERNFIHVFFGFSGEGRVISKEDFWPRMKGLGADEKNVVKDDRSSLLL